LAFALLAVDPRLGVFSLLLTAPDFLLTWAIVARQPRPVPWGLRTLVFLRRLPLCWASLPLALPFSGLVSLPLLFLLVVYETYWEPPRLNSQWPLILVGCVMLPVVITFAFFVARFLEPFVFPGPDRILDGRDNNSSASDATKDSHEFP